MMELSGLEPPTFPAAIKSPLIGRAGTGPDLRVATQEVGGSVQSLHRSSRPAPSTPPMQAVAKHINAEIEWPILGVGWVISHESPRPVRG
jgi:hypothetical protein